MRYYSKRTKKGVIASEAIQDRETASGYRHRKTRAWYLFIPFTIEFLRVTDKNK